MTDRPKRPKQGSYWDEDEQDAADAFMDYQTDLLRRVVEEIEAEHSRYHGDVCRVCRLITEIREAIG